jgi:hypothetical protein
MFQCRRSLLRIWRIRAVRALYDARFLQNCAHARALRLLRDWLSPEQRAQFDAEGQFDAIGSDTGRRYRIRYGTSTNVYEVSDAGSLGTGWCFAPNGRFVPGDVMLSQKLALEVSEAVALAIANRRPPFRQ